MATLVKGASAVQVRSLTRAVVAVVRRPSLWPTALRQMSVLARPQWWRHAPYLPVPSAAYLRFRLVTAYGSDGSQVPTSSDLVTYLEWCRAYPLVVGTHPRD